MGKRVEVYRRLRDLKGMTYEEIAEIFGVTRQAVHHALTRTPGDNFRESTVRKIRFVGLRNWMLKHRVNLVELEKRCGDKRMACLTNSQFNPSKKNIDAILAATGLTYEECFKEDEQDGL